jgi:lipopolysaccharide export system permease protein
VFTNDFPGLVIYVDHIEPPGNTLHGILIADSRERNERNTVFAKLGVLVSNERAHALALRLYDGSIHAFQQEESSYQRTDFATYDISLDLNAALARLRPRHKDPNEVGLAELRARIANKRSDGLPAFAEEVELQRRFSIPFACLAFAVIAVPLGMRPSSAVRSRGFGISLALIFVYYLLLTLGESLGERGVLPAVVALWVPNVLLGALAVVLFARAAQDKFLSTPDFLLAWMARWRARLAALRSGRPQ